MTTNSASRIDASGQAHVQVGDSTSNTISAQNILVHFRDSPHLANISSDAFLDMLASLSHPQKPVHPQTQFRSFRQSFKPFQYLPDFADKAEQISAGTCQWFLGCEDIEFWMRGRGYNILWITGSPGMGKTRLAISFIKDYEISPRQSEGAEKHTTVYSLCVPCENDTAGKIICVAIHQLLERFPDLELTPPMNLAVECGLSINPTEGVAGQEGQWFARADFLWTYFCQLVDLSGLKTVFLVIDGVDECDQKDQEKLFTLLNKGHPNLRVLIISRPLEHIRVLVSKRFAGDILKHLDLHDKEPYINADIARFLEKEMHRIAELRGYTAEQRDLVISRLKDSSSGFLPVVLVLQELELSLSSQLESILDQTADRLDALNGLYETLLSRIPKQVLGKPSTILMYLLYSYQPLRVEELAHLCGYTVASTTKLEGSNFKETGATKYQALRADIRLLSPILRIRTTDDTVQFFHSSAKTFIVEQTSFSATWQSFIPDCARCHCEMAVSCLDTILNACAAIRSKAHLPWEDWRGAEESKLWSIHVFLAYAQRFWVIHVKRAYYYGTKTQSFDLSAVSSKFDILSRRFAMAGSTRLRYFLRFNGWGTKDDMSLRMEAPYHRSSPSPSRNFKGCSPSLAASRAVERPFSAHFNSAIDPLLFYVNFGNAQLLGDLLRKRELSREEKLNSVVLSSMNIHYTMSTVLTTAALGGDLDLLKGVMKNYELLDLESPFFCGILEAAAGSGQQEVVQFIQDKRRTDIRELENALINAVSRGDMKVAKVLLESSNWNPGIRDILGHSILHSVATGSRVDHITFTEIWSLLKQRGLDINAKDALGNTVLHHLSWNPGLGTVDLLKRMVADGADPAIRNNLEQLPLHLAAARLDFEAFEYLLSESEEIFRSRAGSDRSRSMIQSSRNPWAILFSSKGFSTPLHWVAQRGASYDGVRIMKCLLSRGCGLTDATRSGRTPLSLALTDVGSFSNLCSAVTRLDGIDMIVISRMRFDFQTGLCAIFCAECMVRFGVRTARSHQSLRRGGTAFIVYATSDIRFSPGFNCEHWGILSSDVMELEKQHVLALE